jgi:peptidoglycan/LPS O-acetylase OafA/YrhL
MALLDGLRGIAALLVLFYHINSIHDEKGFVFGQGILAVDFFFLLSGFVLTLAFEEKLTRGLGVVPFMKLRVARLWPALVVGIALGAVAHSVLTPSALVLPLILTSLLMIPVFIPNGGYFLLVAVQWSLLLELVANLVHALLLVRLSDKMLMGLCGVSGAVFLYAIVEYGTTGVGCETETFLYGIPRVLFSYSLGVIFARRHGGKAPHRAGWWAVLLALPAVICGVSMLPGQYQPVAQILAVFVAFPLIFRVAIETRLPRQAAPALLWLGAISYPVYTIHYPIFFLTADANALLFPEMNMRIWDAIAIAAVIGLAHVMAVMEGWLRRRRPAASVLRPARA